MILNHQVIRIIGDPFRQDAWGNRPLHNLPKRLSLEVSEPISASCRVSGGNQSTLSIIEKGINYSAVELVGKTPSGKLDSWFRLKTRLSKKLSEGRRL